MTKSKENNANTVSRADRLAAANRYPDLIVVLAALRLLCWRVGTKTKAVLDLARKCQFDLGEAGSWGPYGASEPYLWLIGADPDRLISTVRCGWVRGRDVLCDYAEALMAKGDTLPYWLVEFLVWGTRDGAKARREGCRRSSRAYDNVERDHIIAYTVRYIVDVTGLRPYRNEATRSKEGNLSACKIVARALELIGVGLSEIGVEKIWSEKKGATGAGLLVDPSKRRVQRDGRSRRSA
jgi:hypothetical protein